MVCDFMQQSGFTISKIVTDRPKQIGNGSRKSYHQ